MEALNKLIEQEAEKRYPAITTNNGNLLGAKTSFESGASWMATHMAGLLEWVKVGWVPTEDNSGWMQSAENPDFKKSKLPGITVYSSDDMIEKYFESD